MKVSTEGRTFIEGFEGCVLQAYLCPAGVWTIGYGHTTGVVQGMTITQEEADGLLADDLSITSASLDTMLGATPTTQHQYDALESLCFNIGTGGLRGSTVLRLHKLGDTAGAARAFGLWNKATVNGALQEVPGLTRRRAAEATVYLTPEAAAHPMPEPAPGALESMPQNVASPPPENPVATPPGYRAQDGNVVRVNIQDSAIVKNAGLGNKLATAAAVATASSSGVAAASGMDWRAIAGLCAVLGVALIVALCILLNKSASERVGMWLRGIA